MCGLGCNCNSLAARLVLGHSPVLAGRPHPHASIAFNRIVYLFYRKLDAHTRLMYNGAPTRAAMFYI